MQENDNDKTTTSTTSAVTMELQTGESVAVGSGLSSHQRLFHADTLVAHLSMTQKLDTLGQAWNQASVEERKDMVTVLLEDDPRVVHKSVFEKEYVGNNNNNNNNNNNRGDSESDSQSPSSLLQLYSSLEDIHRLIFLQESLWPKLDKQSQQGIYSFLEVSDSPAKDSRSNNKLNQSPIKCPNSNYLLVGRSCHLMCNSDSDCGGDDNWCTCDLQAFPSLVTGGACTCRCDPDHYTKVKSCKNVPNSLPDDNLVCLAWFDFGICGMGGSAMLSPSFFLMVALSTLLLLALD